MSLHPLAPRPQLAGLEAKLAERSAGHSRALTKQRVEHEAAHRAVIDRLVAEWERSIGTMRSAVTPREYAGRMCVAALTPLPLPLPSSFSLP